MVTLRYSKPSGRLAGTLIHDRAARTSSTIGPHLVDNKVLAHDVAQLIRSERAWAEGGMGCKSFGGEN